MHTRSKGKKNADALSSFPPAFKATALPCQSITGEPLEPPFVPEAACVAVYTNRKIWRDETVLGEKQQIGGLLYSKI